MTRKNCVKLIIFTILFVTNVTVLTAGVKDSVTFPAFEGYEINSAYPVYNSDNLWEYINGGAYTYLNFNFIDLHVAEYVKGETIIKVEVYHHQNSNYAFGMYAQERAPDYSFIKLGVQGYAENTLVNFVKGAWYVKIICNDGDDSTAPILLNLAKLIEKSLSGTTDLPEIFSHFPEQKKIANSESFIATEFLGYGFMPGVFVTSYLNGDKEFKVFIIDTANEDKVNEVYENLKSKAESSKKMKHGVVLLNDKYNGAILVKKKGSAIYGCADNCDLDLFMKFAGGK